MSTTTCTLYSPATHPVAAAYVAASTAERHAARETWLRSDEERGYRFAVYRTVGLQHCDSVSPRRESPHWCRPSELRHRVDLWARAIAAELEPQTATYWFICHAYPVHPRTGRSDHGLLAEYILAVHPEAPLCIGYMTHDWRVVDPSARARRDPGDRQSVLVCLRCGLRHEYRDQASREAPWPWHTYGRSEVEYQGHFWRITKVAKDGLLTLAQQGAPRTQTLTLADILKSGGEEVDEEEQCSGTLSRPSPT